MAYETTFEPTAITPGTPQLRDFRFMGLVQKYPYRTKLGIDNRHGSSTVTINIAGRGKLYRCGPGRFTELEDVIPWYQVDATVATANGDITIYENGGLDTPYERFAPPTEVG